MRAGGLRGKGAGSADEEPMGAVEEDVNEGRRESGREDVDGARLRLKYEPRPEEEEGGAGTSSGVASVWMLRFVVM